jgi:transcriptional regulator with XRE-family HTH domain
MSYDSPMNESKLGLRLRALRMKKKLSLQELADKIGASKAHVWDLEQGKTRNPSLSLLTELSRALDSSIKDLVGEAEEVTEGEEVELGTLFRDLRGLDSATLEVIRTMTKTLREMKDGKKPKD